MSLTIKNHSVYSDGRILIPKSLSEEKSLLLKFAILLLHHASFLQDKEIGKICASTFFSKKFTIIISFSSGASVQVEYTNSPPFRRFSQNFCNNSVCNRDFLRIFFSDQKPKLFSFCREILPSALHGASSKILSNNAADSNFLASIL